MVEFLINERKLLIMKLDYIWSQLLTMEGQKQKKNIIVYMYHSTLFGMIM